MHTEFVNWILAAIVGDIIAVVIVILVLSVIYKIQNR